MTSRPDLPAFAALLPWEVESSEVEKLEQSRKVAFPTVLGVFVSLDAKGFVVIEQDDSFAPPDAIVFPAHYAEAVAAAILDAAKGA